MKVVHSMKRRVALLGVTVLALAPMYAISAAPASAGHIVDQGCVHYREHKGPYTAWTVDGFLRCDGKPVWRKPDIRRGPDGACKKMIPHHRVFWTGIGSGALPWEHAVVRLEPCGSG